MCDKVNTNLLRDLRKHIIALRLTDPEFEMVQSLMKVMQIRKGTVLRVALEELFKAKGGHNGAA